MTKQCQSCGMPIKNNSLKGTEKDGSLSDVYCCLCYKDGKFIDPTLTIETMQQIVEVSLKEKHWPKILRIMAQKQIPRLKRWN